MNSLKDSWVARHGLTVVGMGIVGMAAFFSLQSEVSVLARDQASADTTLVELKADMKEVKDTQTKETTASRVYRAEQRAFNEKLLESLKRLEDRQQR